MDNSLGEQFCAGCCGICCAACTESLEAWCMMTTCCQGSDTREAGCCGSCCKKSFDEDSFFDEERKRDREAARHGASTSATGKPKAVNSQPSPRPSMSPTRSTANNGEGVKADIRRSSVSEAQEGDDVNGTSTGARVTTP